MEQFEKDAQENLIKTSLANDPDLKFDDPNICTYEKKLEQLYEFEDDLLREDRILKENRRGLQTICRMTGGTQSYFLFDAEIMQIAPFLLSTTFLKDDSQQSESALDINRSNNKRS